MNNSIIRILITSCMIFVASVSFTARAAQLNDERIEASVEHIKVKAQEATQAAKEVVATSVEVVQEYTLTARERVINWVNSLKKLGAIAVGSAALSVAKIFNNLADKMDEACAEAELSDQEHEERA